MVYFPFFTHKLFIERVNTKYIISVKINNIEWLALFHGLESKPRATRGRSEALCIPQARKPRTDLGNQHPIGRNCFWRRTRFADPLKISKHVLLAQQHEHGSVCYEKKHLLVELNKIFVLRVKK